MLCVVRLTRDEFDGDVWYLGVGDEFLHLLKIDTQWQIVQADD